MNLVPGKNFKDLKPNDEEILLSVIVPCFNEIQTISQVIEKIKDSPVNNIEIIVVDDFSNDGSREFLKNLKDNLVNVIFSSN